MQAVKHEFVLYLESNSIPFLVLGRGHCKTDEKSSIKQWLRFYFLHNFRKKKSAINNFLLILYYGKNL